MLSPVAQAQQLARDKAQSIAGNYAHALVIGSDTLIEIDGNLLGKPKDLREAEGMLHRLRGKPHTVHTGLALLRVDTNLSVGFTESARVWMKAFSEEELSRYLLTKESLGKAGAYSIQGEGAQLIEKIDGDYPTIVGLPLWRTAKLLEENGVVLPKAVEEVYRLKPYANWNDFK